jgi:hypothetical protein
MVRKIRKISYLNNKLSELQNSPDCLGRLEHKVLSINNNSLRFMFPLGTEETSAGSQSMQKIREFGKACVQMGWLMAIEEMRGKIL